MNTLSRRALLKMMSAAPMAAAFSVTDAEAQHAHEQAQSARQRAQKAAAAFKPQFFTEQEYATVRILVDLIIPADERSGSATEAGVPEFMDFIMIDMPTRQTPMRGGLAWLDLESQSRFDTTFRAATDAQRRQILDDLSTYGEIKPALSHGRAFFRSFRDLTASGFWTSKVGMKDLGYLGNVPVAQWKGCPEEVLSRLGLPGD